MDAAALEASLINAQLPGSLETVYTKPESYASCLTCHGTIKDQVGKMNCHGCHSTSEVTLVGSGHERYVAAPNNRKKR